MRKVLLLVLLSVLMSSQLVSQTTSGSKVTLARLGVRDESMEKALSYISEYIRSKPQGLRFPITKITFTGVKDGVSYEVKGIDNTWADIFNYGESTYGYAVVAGRLFIIMGLTEEDVDMNPYFYLIDESKSFSRNILPPTGLAKCPIWYFDHINGVSTKVMEKDLDILDK